MKKDRSINILFIIQHPAHVHQFRILIDLLKKKGNRIVVLAVEKDVTLDLLKKYKISFIKLSINKGNIFLKFFDIFPQILKIYNVLKKKKIDLIISRGNPAASIISFFKKTKHIIFSDSEPVFIDRIFLWFSDLLITPINFRKNYGKKHFKANSYKELAYLHPKYFNKKIKIKSLLGLSGSDKFYLLRFVAWKANHDINRKGLNREAKKRLIRILKEKGRVYISSEKELEIDFKKYKFPLKPDFIHHALSEAELFIGDSQTMATEAAILGTPAVRINSWVGKNDMGNFIELEKKYKLIYNFNDFELACLKIEELLKMNDIKAKWKVKQLKLLSDKCDMNEYMLKIINKVVYT